jgi:hypothetical protein
VSDQSGQTGAMSERQGVSRSGLLKLGLAIVVVATALGLGITALLPTTHHTKHASVTTTTAPCAREQALVFFDEGLLAQSGPGTLSKPSFAAQALGEAQAKLAACVAALSDRPQDQTHKASSGLGK